MTDVAGGLIAFICLFLWMASGGWAFAKLAYGTDSDGLKGMVLACFLFAPFMAGYAWAVRDKEPQP